MSETAALERALKVIEARLAEAGLDYPSDPRHSTGNLPRVAIVAGSGLGGLERWVSPEATLGFEALGAWEPGAVEGHAGRWIIGQFGNVGVHLLLGRRHLYEGAGEASVAFFPRVLAALGVRWLILTNAAGGLTNRLEPGDLMLIRDHLDLTFGTGRIEPPSTAPRTADRPRGRSGGGSPYDRAANGLFAAAALEAQIALREGVYAAVTGPSYETPAEAAMLRRLGAQAVGMSTVPEAQRAARLGLRVVGLSCITNSCFRGQGPLSHEEVLAQSARVVDRLARLLGAALARLGELGS